MDWATINAVAGVIGTVGGTFGGWVVRRSAERRAAMNAREEAARADRLEARNERESERQAEQSAQAAAIAERDALIRTITETLIDPLRKEVAELRDWKAKAEKRIDESEERNDRLVAFIYKLIGIIHRAGLDAEILPADVPPGIHL
jgi:hypothetical protein